ncbi:hypothetical protein BS78_04G219700 [Paspalum vaginatum]|nr:hypothetical protein BS78_04G219700 [Paspalum vaginatum]
MNPVTREIVQLCIPWLLVIQMTKKSWHRCAAYAPHHDQSKATEEASQATKHNQSGSSGPNAPPKKKAWSKYLALLSRFQNKMKHRKPDGLRQRSPIKRFSSRSMLEECGNVAVARVIRRAAADCFAAAVAGGDDDEPPCYVQLDQVRYGVKREAFGPIYLVT